MTTISPVNGSSIPVVPKGSGEAKLDQNAFLRLMTTQLKEQDPFNPIDNTQMVAQMAQLKEQDPFDPVDNTAMVAQMAQFSSVAGISEMNTSLKAIADQITEQTTLLTAIKAATVPPPGA